MVVGTSPPLLPAKVQVEGFLLGAEEVPLTLVKERNRILASNPALSISLNNHQAFGLGVVTYSTESTPTDTGGSISSGHLDCGQPAKRGCADFAVTNTNSVC